MTENNNNKSREMIQQMNEQSKKLVESMNNQSKEILDRMKLKNVKEFQEESVEEFKKAGREPI